MTLLRGLIVFARLSTGLAVWVAAFTAPFSFTRQAHAATQKHWIEHEVLPGESLRGIAQRYYGDAAWWLHIYHTNASTLKNPNAAVRPGTKLKIELTGPGPKSGMHAVAPNTPGPPNTTQIQVKDGDTLETLAQAHMGSSRFWPRILQLNRSKIGPTHELTPGTYLRVQELAGTPAPVLRRTRAHRETYAAVDAADDSSPINQTGQTGQTGQSEDRPVAIGAPVPVPASAGRSPAAEKPVASPRASAAALAHYDDFIEP